MQVSRTPGAAIENRNARHYFVGHLAGWATIHCRVDEFIAQNDRVVALREVSFQHTKSGKIAVTPKADFHRFSGGKSCHSKPAVPTTH